MSRRSPALVLAAAIAAAPLLLLTACSDDDPSKPTITLKEETINPNVTVPTT
jgi:hypothetical protein